MCETHDPTGEPDAVNPPVRFGERRLETEPWRGVRHRHCESCREQLPPSAYRYRASRRLYPFPQPTPTWREHQKAGGAQATHGSDLAVLPQTPSVLGTTVRLAFAHTDPQLPPTFWCFHSGRPKFPHSRYYAILLLTGCCPAQVHKRGGAK